MKHLTPMVATKRRLTATHHSRLNEGVERLNETLQTALRTTSLDEKVKILS